MGPLKLSLLNTHMESTGEHADERMNQLNISFEELSKTDKSVNVIMGGDLNMRDKEVSMKCWNGKRLFKTISLLLAGYCRRTSRPHIRPVGSVWFAKGMPMDMGYDEEHQQGVPRQIQTSLSLWSHLLASGHVEFRCAQILWPDWFTENFRVSVFSKRSLGIASRFRC